MLRDEVATYIKDWPETKVYNCAEATFRGTNDYYHLGLNEDTLKITASFGGGMFSGEACGIVTAGCAAIAKLNPVNEPPYANENVIDSTKAWLQAFKDKYGSVSCRDLKENCDCKILVQEAADLFESITPPAE